MPREIYLLKVGMTMTEGMVSEWYIADGAPVKKGEMVYALETEKVNLDVDAEADGIVKHVVEAGVTKEPGDVVGYIFAADEPIPADFGGVGGAGSTDSAGKGADAVPAAVEAAAEQVAPVAQSDTAATATQVADGDGRQKSSPAARRLARELGVDIAGLTGSGPGGRVVEADVSAAESNKPKVSPLAKRMAAERGIDLTTVKGSGPGGRIVQADIEGAPATATQTASAGKRAAPVGPAAGERVPVKGMRKTIASRMHHSLQESAQLTMTMEVIMDDAVKLRGSLIQEWEGEGIRPTYTDLVVKAVAKALQSFPMMNSQFAGNEIILLEEINVGIAVALPEGLVVPVVRGADQMPVKDLAVESSRLASAARDGSLGLDDFAGGTFTVSALGMYGVDSFTPIINEPQTGILGVNRIYDGVEWDGDKAVKTKKMNLSLTWDHRVVDGAPAAEYLVEVKKLLESPFRLLL